MTIEQRAREAKAHYDSLPADERRALKRAQRESYVRAMTTPCEHGVLDFEQCGDCRAVAKP